ncbi:two-component sensor histidine kinase [Chitinophaga cymbidii]|uniref:histidine kinase n=1 Tax=Chitinophaga cymbidii TaxID=1096750 RepID=A0A512RPV7_9BACT|nr:two-component sensor histidine kinase [Chitinophaga cymbidii]
MYTDDVDEAIMLRKKEFLTNNIATLTGNDIPTWNKFNRDIRILPDTITSQPKDTIIQETFLDVLAPEWEPYRVLYTNVEIQGNSYVLMIQLNLVESEDLIKAIVWIYLGVLVGLLIVIFFLTRFISNRLWKPFYTTLQLIDQFNLEKLVTPRFDEVNTYEFQKLNQGLNKLISESLRSFSAQKVFTQNAAHELQTPLAVLQSKLDLLMQDESLTSSQAAVVQSLYDSTSRLSRINKNLLLLAKIENNQFADTEKVNISELINEVLPYFTEQADGKKLSITTSLQTAINLLSNKGLTEILINNFILNAIRHNVEGGRIIIISAPDRLVIQNTGIEHPLDTAMLYSRFGKNATDTRNNGLGLAIAKEICDRYNWQITYQYDGLHNFSILF